MRRLLDERRSYLWRCVADTKSGRWILQKRKLAAADCPFPPQKTFSFVEAAGLISSHLMNKLRVGQQLVLTTIDVSCLRDEVTFGIWITQVFIFFKKSIEILIPYWFFCDSCFILSTTRLLFLLMQRFCLDEEGARSNNVGSESMMDNICANQVITYMRYYTIYNIKAEMVPRQPRQCHYSILKQA